MDRPILFSAPMIRALLDGRKRQTRRILKLPTKGIYIHPQMGGWAPTTVGGGSSFTIDRYGNRHPAREMVAIWHQTCGTCITAPHQVGDRLWVREAWRTTVDLDGSSPIAMAKSCTEAGYRRPWAPLRYEADATQVNWDKQWAARLRASMHMPRWASRLTLTVTGVKVERLQEISEADAEAEGAEPILVPPDGGSAPHSEGFRMIWEKINGEASWDANPWVAAYSFTVEQKNIDA
jgi:hypothetical protein